MKPDSLMASCGGSCTSYEAFRNSFACRGDKLFEHIFDENSDLIKIKKKRVAIANLKKLFKGAFKISAKIGFHEMSLRDLSRETGVSMGSIYSSISKKDNLGIIVKNVVSELSKNNIKRGGQQTDALSRLEATICLQFYTSCLLQPWFSFLYMETRSLPESHQRDSKEIEATTIASFASHIKAGIDEGTFKTQQGPFLAHNILALLQDWYLKPWKHNYNKQSRDAYLANIISMVRTSLGVETFSALQA